MIYSEYDNLAAIYTFQCFASHTPYHFHIKHYIHSRKYIYNLHIQTFTCGNLRVLVQFFHSSRYIYDLMSPFARIATRIYDPTIIYIVFRKRLRRNRWKKKICFQRRCLLYVKILENLHLLSGLLSKTSGNYLIWIKII